MNTSDLEMAALALASQSLAGAASFRSYHHRVGKKLKAT